MNKKVILFGGGGHAKVVMECLMEHGDFIMGFVDDNPKAALFELQYLGTYHSAMAPEAHLIMAIGNNRIRKKVSEKVSHLFSNAIHPSALISRSAKVGVGCMIFHNTIIQAISVIGNHVILNTAAQVDHDCIIGDYVHIGPGAVLCGNVVVGEGSLVGAGSVILPGVKIGEWCTIAAGSVVTKNISDGAIAIGAPAKIMKS